MNGTGRGIKEAEPEDGGSEKLPTPGLLGEVLVPWDELGCTHSAKAQKQ